MGFPAFFDDAPVLRVRDPLSRVLGATPDGVIEYRYADAVRLAGHSCPTLAGTWLCARAGLQALYGDGLPERGGVAVSLPEPEDAGVAGVVGQLLTLVIGAAGAGGFKGLGGRHGRKDLLRYGDAGSGALRLRRLDTGATVEVEADASRIPMEPAQRVLMPLVLQGGADASQLHEFGRLWQDRVRRMLVEHADDPNLVHVRRVA